MPAPISLDYPYDKAPEFGEVLEAAPGLLWLRLPLPFSLRAINIWLLEEGDGWTVIDTGLNYPATQEIWEDLHKGVMGGRPVKRLIVTHMHPDHVGYAGWFVERFGVALEMTRTEYVTARMLVADTGRPAPEEGVRFYTAAGYSDEQIETYKKRFGMFGLGVYKMPESFTRIGHGDVLTLGGRDWRVLTGGGHSPEHASLYCADEDLYISGDQVLPTISSNVSCWPTEPYGDPLSEWFAALRMVKENVGGDALVFPSHQKVFRGLHERVDYLLAEHDEGLEALYDHVAEPKRVVDVFSTLFRRDVPADQVGLATGEAVAHLNHLVARGAIVREQDTHGVDWYRQS